MKNILVAAIFLFSQLGFSAEKANQVKTTKAKTTQAQAKKNFQIESLTFSQLLLTKEELVHLSENDKQTYLFAMIALGQIIEGSQRYHMDYEDKVVTAKQIEKQNTFSEKYAYLFYALVPQVHAIWGVVLTRVAPMLARAGSWVVARAEGALAKSAVSAKNAAQMSFEFAPSKEALAKMSKTAAESAKKLQKAQDDAMNALKKNRGAKSTLKEETALADARAAFAAEKDAFLKAGGTAEQFAKVANESGLKKVMMWPFRNKMNIVGGGLAGYGLDTIILDKTGMSFEKLFEKAAVGVQSFASGTDLSGPAIITADQIKAMKAGDSAKAVGKTCLFGGLPSNWTDQGGTPKCTRPAEASNENCKQENGKFQCPNYGIKLTSGTIDTSLCIDTIKMDNLTVRCSGTLTAVLEAKAATVDSTDMETALQKNFGEVIAGLETNVRMKNDKGETKSIFEYCMADNVDQKTECGAINEMISVLKKTEIKKILETRVQLAQTAPAATAPAGLNPEADAKAAGTKQ